MFSAHGSILTLAIAICVAAIVIIVLVISRANILFDVVLLGGRVRLVIPIFAIVILWQQEQARIVDIV